MEEAFDEYFPSEGPDKVRSRTPSVSGNVAASTQGLDFRVRAEVLLH